MKFISHKLRYLFFKQTKYFYFLLVLYIIAPILFVYFLAGVQHPERITEGIGRSGIGQIYITAVIVFTYFFIRYVLKTLRNYEKRNNLESVDSFIASLKENRSEAYCLIIRSFGSDECLLVEESLDVSNPFKSNAFTSQYSAVESGRDSEVAFLYPKLTLYERFRSKFRGGIGLLILPNKFTVPTSIEAIVAETAKVSFDAETISLADPAMRMFPRSVRYLVANDSNWKDAISLLLKRTLVPVLIYQPGTIVGYATKWETEQIRDLEILHRFVIVLPPPNSQHYREAYESLLSLEKELPYTTNLPRESDQKPIVICVDDRNEVNCFYSKNDARTTSEDYTRSIFLAFKVIKSHIRTVGNEALYSQWNERLIEDFRQRYSL